MNILPLIKMDNLIKGIKNQILILQKLNKSLSLLLKDDPDVSNQYGVLIKEIPKIEAIIPDLSLSDSFKSEIIKTLEAARIKRDTIQNGIGAKIGSSLASLLQAENIQLEGRYPLFHASLYSIEVNFQSGKATIWFGPDKIEKLIQCKSTPEEIKKTLLKCNSQITGRKFDEEKFLKLLYRAYLSAITENGKTEGDEIGISEILPFVALYNQANAFRRDPKQKNYREYDRPQFAYDLAQVWSGEKRGFDIRFTPASRIDTKTWYTFLHIPPVNRHKNWQHIASIKMSKQVK